MVEKDEFKLVKRVQRGDRAAFKELYGIYAGRIYALALRMTANKGAAEDLTQEIFLRVWEKAGTFAFRSTFYTWLHRLALNLIIRKGRKYKEADSRELELEVGEQRQAEGTNRTEGLENRLDCERALLKLPGQARKVFILHDMEGYTHREIKELLDISEGASKAHLSRARQLLKKELKL